MHLPTSISFIARCRERGSSFLLCCVISFVTWQCECRHCFCFLLSLPLLNSPYNICTCASWLYYLHVYTLACMCLCFVYNQNSLERIVVLVNIYTTTLLLFGWSYLYRGEHYNRIMNSTVTTLFMTLCLYTPCIYQYTKCVTRHHYG